MEGTRIYIKFEGDYAYLNETKRLRNTFLTILKGIDNPIWLEVEIQGQLRSGNRLVIKIVNYEPSEKAFTEYQSSSETLSKVESISLPGGANTHSLIRIKRHSSNISSKNKSQESERGNLTSPQKKETKDDNQLLSPQIPIEDIPFEEVEIINDIVRISWKNITLTEEAAVCKVQIKGYQVFVEILNPFIQAGFDPLKKYIKRVLGSDFITASIKYEKRQFGIHVLKASSKDIEFIDDAIIEKVKLPLLKDVFSSRSRRKLEKEFYDAEEFLGEAIKDKDVYDDLFENEEDFFNQFIQAIEPKHYKHLEYLAKKHLYQEASIQYFPQPLSFLFYLKKDSRSVIIWETLDTKEATYIWTFEGGTNPLKINANIEFCKGEIKLIFAIQKQNYLKQRPQNFHRIIHDYISPEGFKRWKKELKTFL